MEAIEGILAAVSPIRKNDSEGEFLVTNIHGIEIPVPYSCVKDDAGKLSQIIRLIRKDVTHDTVLNFYELHLQTI
ncbi:hypothetical protein [Rugamonas rubra]|uniref:Uncharacterized protein n=1 Tax=Rugamonas rubra TaxID=758825 RepID=A0A1I4RYK9_9BURK|nr:hypothetical protein [Rugamonas rubra]SFM57386.1 hypothetical protein SAMN02982985_04530 [Rugamonas rubra]